MPSEFVVKFEMEKDYSAGYLSYADRHIKDELKIRYLQAQYKRFEDFHKREIREMEIRTRNKMHGYARACLQTIRGELEDEYRFIMTQFDLYKREEATHKARIKALEDKII